MIKITKEAEPTCLTHLRLDPDTVYSDLKNGCLEEVRAQLSKEQKHLCAYCQRTFESTVFIEHYIPQTVDASKQLVYENFLGVCSGKYYVDRKSGKKIDFCNVWRGSKPLTINPLEEEDMAGIYYDDDDMIHSTNVTFDKELNDILNLNFDELCKARKNSFDNVQNTIMDMTDLLKISKIEAYQKAIKLVEKDNPIFSGFVLYRFRKLLEYHQEKNKNE